MQGCNVMDPLAIVGVLIQIMEMKYWVLERLLEKEKLLVVWTINICILFLLGYSDKILLG